MIRHRLHLPENSESAGLRLALKLFANAGAYGIYAELNPQELPATPDPHRAKKPSEPCGCRKPILAGQIPSLVEP